MPRKKSSALRISEPSDLSSLSKRKRSMLSGSDDNRSTQEPISSPSLSPNRLSVAKQQRKTRSDFFQSGTSSESMSKGVSLDGARRMALKHIETFVLTFSDPLTFSSAAASSAPAALTQVTEGARIQEAGHLRCSGAEIGRFVIMLRNPSSVLKSCAAFALLQFTIPGGRHAMHHASIMQMEEQHGFCELQKMHLLKPKYLQKSCFAILSITTYGTIAIDHLSTLFLCLEWSLMEAGFMPELRM